MSVGEVKNRSKKSYILYILSWSLSICPGNVQNNKVVWNIHNNKINACNVVGKPFEWLQLKHHMLQDEECKILENMMKKSKPNSQYINQSNNWKYLSIQGLPESCSILSENLNAC